MRRAGAPADTLFFAGLPSGSDDDRFLRAAIRLPVREVKLLSKPGKKALAWASFFNEADCVAALVALRRGSPELKVRLHTPRAGSGTAGPGAAAAEKAEKAAAAAPAPVEVFRARAEKIVAEGGLANSLMLRGLPLEVGLDELGAVILALDARCRPLRVRTSEGKVGKAGKARNFWLTYASQDDACAAFVAMHGRQASFRCGKTSRLVPVVHNDATDGESKVRRSREANIAASAANHARAAEASNMGGLPQNPSQGAMDYDSAAAGSARGGGVAGASARSGASAGVGSLDRLEDFLRGQPGKLLFLSKSGQP